jgi:hypothetical protein
MAKASRTKDAEANARRKLADAQARLYSAQEKRTRVLQKGEQDVEQARRRAAARLEKATTVVERRAGKVARAEARLLTLQRKKGNPAGLSASLAARPDLVPAAADLLEDLQSQALEEHDAEEIVALDSVAAQMPAAAIADETSQSERTLLAALRDGFPGGATYTEWLAAAPMAKRTFLRTRRVLVDRGLVARDGAGQGARYTVTEQGAELLDME